MKTLDLYIPNMFNDRVIKSDHADNVANNVARLTRVDESYACDNDAFDFVFTFYITNLSSDRGPPF